MKITYNWLKEYVDFAWDWPELVERLTMAGLEFEGVEDLGARYEASSSAASTPVAHTKTPTA